MSPPGILTDDLFESLNAGRMQERGKERRN